MQPVNNFDMSIAKRIPFNEHYLAELRVDIYNGFNHPQYIPGRPNRVTAVIHPGGSVRDDEILQAVEEHGMAMVLTGRRHFRH